MLSAVLENDGQQLSAAQTHNQHYRDLLANVLPPGHRAEPGHQARWLWRTLRTAELVGLDPARVLAKAVAERDLAGSRGVPAVIDARIHYRLGSVVPLPPRSWSAQVPIIADPDRRALPWAIIALGPVPEDPVDRLDWQQRAASIGAWRELSGYDHPHRPHRTRTHRSRPGQADRLV